MKKWASESSGTRPNASTAGNVIESKHVHDFQACSCGRIFVDGGHDYLRWGFKSKDDFIDLSEVEEVEEDCGVQEAEEAVGMSEKLKPCPFCGGHATFCYYNLNSAFFSVYCRA